MITTRAQVFPSGGGKMGEYIRTINWEETSVGHPDQWPATLRTAVNLLLHSRFPMFVWWGSDLLTFYNDAYMEILGDKHPQAFCTSGYKVWAEIWDVVGPLADRVLHDGEPCWAEDQLLYINRRGYIEESYFTFSYSPLTDEDGTVKGVFCACTETTEKVLASRSMSESERNLRNTIMQAPVAMCILKGENFVVEIANPLMIKLWGRKEKEILYHPIFEGLPEAKEQGLEEILKKVLTKGETFVAHERPVNLPREGSIETVYLNFVYEPFSIQDQVAGVMAVAVDVTPQVLARKRLEENEAVLQARVQERTEELENQKTLLDNILTNSSNGISVSETIRDANGNVIDGTTILANEAAINLTGLPKEIYLSKTATELDPGFLKSEYFRMCLKTLETGEPTLSQYFLEHTGKWLELTVSKMDEEHLIHIFTDVTHIKEAQLQLERTVDELKKSNANLEEFAYAASHDLKEPIRKINYFSERLKHELQEKLSPSQSQLFSRMENAAKRMGTLVDDLLAYSHATKGLSKVEEIDLNEKLHTVLEDLELEVQEKHAVINAGTLPVIQGNRRQMQQLLLNLLGNALKYHKPGVPPVVEIKTTLVKGKDFPHAFSSEDAIKPYHLVEVSDNGIGFEPEHAEQIFKVFTRLHSNAEYKGSGVGLSIARKVVENHGGIIWAEGTPGQGASFMFLLPANG